ncbi:MAG: hypothetical protein GXX83_07245 [Gaiellales bacterium]|nr:hypothetical protein [Gaiellales bacterium]
MKRALIVLLTGLVLLLAVSGTVLAAGGTSPDDIYNDWKTNPGTLKGTYTDDQLRAVLNDPTLLQYGDPSVLDPLVDYIKNLLSPGQPGEPGRSTFPFTGAQMALVAGGAVALIGLGLVLRRSSKPRKADG